MRGNVAGGRRWGAALGVAAALAAVVVAPPPAAGYTLKTTASCSQLTWSGTPQVKIHFGEFEGDFVQALQMIEAITEVHEQFNLVGATSARVTTTVQSVYDPFVFGSWFNDATPTIHVGFTPTMSGNAIGGALIGPTSVATCDHDEAHIEFLDMENWDWNFGTPEMVGEQYYETGKSDDTGATYFRHSYLHELLHTYGLAHSPDSYAVMNYGDRAWPNRPEREGIRPLPDDVEALRDLYPAAGTRTEVALFNSWYDPNDTSDGTYPAANQKLLCKPSLGSGWSADRFADKCGTGGANSGSTTVCAGNTLRARLALANYSTASVDVTARLWFSTDDVYQWYDTISATSHAFTVSAQGSTQQGLTWHVPTLGATGTTYHVIARVTATTPSGVTVGDWIPLRGTVQAC